MASIRQQINIAAGVRTVWSTLLSADGWKSWWAEEARVIPEEGGRIVLQVEGDEGLLEERGLFQSIRPTRKIEIRWDRHSKGPMAGSRLQFNLARDGDETRLSVVCGPFEDDERRALVDGEWRQGLKALRRALEGDA